MIFKDNVCANLEEMTDMVDPVSIKACVCRWLIKVDTWMSLKIGRDFSLNYELHQKYLTKLLDDKMFVFLVLTWA